MTERRRVSERDDDMRTPGVCSIERRHSRRPLAIGAHKKKQMPFVYARRVRRDAP